MKKLFLLLFLTICTLSCTVVSKKDTSKKSTAIPTDKNVKKGVLSNGMTYYIRQNAKPEDKVELRLVVKAGSVLEKENQLGLAHFMEHMNFNGTKNFKKNELVDYLQSIGVQFGAHLNAYTSFNETVYILPIPSDDDEKLEKGLQIIEDWAFNALLTSEEIEKERGVVLEEYRLGLGASKRMLAEYLPKIMYNSRYAERLPIGTKEVLENFKHDDLRSFYKDWYRPELMAVVAVGDISVESIEQKIKTHFSKYPKTKKAPKRVSYTLPNHNETLISIATDKEAANSVVQIYYKDTQITEPISTEAQYKNNMLHNLFTIMLNNRLDEIRNSETPPFIYARSGYSYLWDKAKKSYSAFALSSEDGQLKAFETLLIENERILRHGFLQSELDRAKKLFLNGLEKAYNERSKTESNNYCSEYIQHFLTNEPYPGIEWEFLTSKKLIQTIQLKDYSNLISKFIHNNNRVVVFTGPEKENLVKVKEQDVLTILDQVKTKNIAPYSEKSIRKNLIENKPTAGNILKTDKNEQYNITTLTLSNGAKVHYKKTDFKDNQILFSTFSFGGQSMYTTKENRQTSLANNALTEAGIGGLSKVDLQKLLAGKSVSAFPYISEISEGIDGSCTPKDLETFLQVVHLYFTQLNYDEKAYASFETRLKGYFKNLISNPSQYFAIELDKYLNQNNERFVGFPDEQLWSETDYKLAHQKYQERFANAADFNFYFVGNFDETTLQNHIKTYIASLPSSKKLENYKKHPVQFLKGKLTKNIKKGTEPKSSVNIIYKGNMKHEDILEKDHYYLQSLGEVLTIKLIEKIREEEGGVYGVRAYGSTTKIPYGQYNFNIKFPCGPENVEKLTKITIAELDKIKQNGISTKDLLKIKETQRLAHKEALKDNNFWLNSIKNKEFYKIAIDESINTSNKIDQLSSDNLKYIANKFLVKNRIIATHNPEN